MRNWRLGALLFAAGSVVVGHAQVTFTGSNNVNTPGPGDFYLANGGNGSLTISSGAALTTTDFGIIGYSSGSTGTVTVQGAGSTLTDNYSSYLFQLYVGYGGTGNLNILNGGTVQTTGSAAIGMSSNTVSTATVNGAGSSWSVSEELMVGYGGTGNLNITGGGAVNLSGEPVQFIGFDVGANGTVTVSGANSSLNYASSSGTLYLGSSGATGTLNINQGATVTTAGTVALGIDNSYYNVPGSGVANVNGATWNTGNLIVGYGTQGNLSITGGATVTSASAVLGSVIGTDIGTEYGTGRASVSGLGSSWTTGSLTIGQAGTGVLTLSSSGVVNVGGLGGGGTLLLGSEANSAGTLNIGGAQYSGPQAGGILNAATVTTGSGAGYIRFNTTGSAASPYYFTNDGTATGGAISVTGATQLFNTAGVNGLTGLIAAQGGIEIDGGALLIANGGDLQNSSLLTNNAGGIVENINGYLNAGGQYQANTSGNSSTFANGYLARVDNGNSTGAGLFINGAYTTLPAFVPGSAVPVAWDNDGAVFTNTGGTFNNENGSHFDNIGAGSIATNTFGGIINNFSGYLDNSYTYQGNTTAAVSTIKNENGATLNNGDGHGDALIVNGGYGSTEGFAPTVTQELFQGDGAAFLNSGATLNNQNGSLLDNVGAGSVLTNTAGGVINNYSGYLDSSDDYQVNTSGHASLIENSHGATLVNGDANGLGLILNGGYASAAPFIPSVTTATYPNDGALLLNDDATVDNGNGSHLDNVGSNSLLSNTDGGVINNMGGYLGAAENYNLSTTGQTSTIKNLFGGTLNNGDAGGFGGMVNGGFEAAAGGPIVAGAGNALLLNDASTINNQNGSQITNVGAGSVVTNTDGGVINNYNGYLDSGGNYNTNTTGFTSAINNEAGGLVNNGDGAGAGLIINGAFTAGSFSPGTTPLVTAQNDGALLVNDASTINNQNGSQIVNIGTGSVLTNTAGGVVSSYSGYLDSGGNYDANTTGATSTIENEAGATIDNGDANGRGLILNGAYATTLFIPAVQANYNDDGALLVNDAATINNQNGSHLDNFGIGSVLTNTDGAVIGNYSGYLDSGGNYNANTTGFTSTIRNEAGGLLNNGDGSGAGLIVNGGYAAGSFSPGTSPVIAAQNDGALLLNDASAINNQNGSQIVNIGAGSVVTNTDGGVISNFSGYLDSGGNYNANTTGYTSTISNGAGATINNGDGSGAGLIVNGGYANSSTYTPGVPDVTATNDGAQFTNASATILNQNGSAFVNTGSGSVLTNTSGGAIDNVGGYFDSNNNYQGNTTGAPSTIVNQANAVLNNGDVNGLGVILNGGYATAGGNYTPGSPAYSAGGSALLLNSGATINNQNGSNIDNWGGGAVLTNTAGGVINNFSFSTSAGYQANSTGFTSALYNQFGATLNNGDGSGAGMIINGGYSTNGALYSISVETFETYDFSGALLYNSATINNQNGSLILNGGGSAASVLTNTGGGVINNVQGYLSGAGYSANTAGGTTQLYNWLDGVIDNGDNSGAGLIVNGGYAAGPFNPGTTPVIATQNDGGGLVNVGATINNQNGSQIVNIGAGSTLFNTQGGAIDNVGGYFDSNGNYQGNTTGAPSTLINEGGALLVNGDHLGLGVILNGGYSEAGGHYTPGSLAYEEGGNVLLLNSGATFRNQNGSNINNWGGGVVLTNTAGGVLDNFSGYLNTDGTYGVNTTNFTSSIYNWSGAVVNNGDSTGAGLIVNGGYANSSTFTPGVTTVTTTSDGAQFTNASSSIRNQNGSEFVNTGSGSVLTNTSGGSIDNLGGYFDSTNQYQNSTTGSPTVISNTDGAVLNNGDNNGLGGLLNGAYAAAGGNYRPGTLAYSVGGSALLLNSGATINNQNGSNIDNWGGGAVLTNTAGGVINNFSFSTSAGYQANSTGFTSALYNQFGATLNNGDGSGAGMIINGGYSTNGALYSISVETFETYDFSGALLYNSATINNQNGSLILNGGGSAASVLTNTGGGVINNVQGYLSGAGYSANTAGGTTQLYNWLDGVIDNGDHSGAGLIVNGGYAAGPFNPGTSPVIATQNDGGGLVNVGATINNQNGSQIVNIGAGSTLFNTQGGAIDNVGGYFDSNGNYQANTTGAPSTLINEGGALLVNGDHLGLGVILNGGYSEAGGHYTPGSLAYEEGGDVLLLNSGATLRNQNGSNINNWGGGVVLTNTAGGVLDNFSGYLNTDGTYGVNTTNFTSSIYNWSGAVVNNGDGSGAGLIVNGGYANSSTFTPGVTTVTTTSDGAQFTNASSTIRNQNGSEFVNTGSGSVLTNTSGGSIDNLGGYFDSTNQYQNSTTGSPTIISNTDGAVLNNGDNNGLGGLLNGAYAAAGGNYRPGTLAYSVGGSALLLNSGATINNQNGSNIDNWGGGAVLTNTAGGVINNFSGYDMTSSFNGYQNNTTGSTSAIYNQFGATLNNGDATGGGYIVNGGLVTNATFTGPALYTPGAAAPKVYGNDGALFYNSATINNQNGSVICNIGQGAVLTNTDGGVINNDSGYVDAHGDEQPNTTGAVSTLTNIYGAVFNNGDSTGAGSLFNSGGALFQNVQATFNNQNGSLVTNQGSGSVFVNAANSSLNNDATSQINNLSGASLQNSGTFTNNGAVTNDSDFENAGAFADNGSLQGTGNFTQSAGATQVQGTFAQATLTVNGGSFTQTGTTTISGDTTNGGTVTLTAGTFTDSGTFTNSGTLTISAGATLDAGIYDQLVGATLIDGGTLDPAAIDVDGGVFGGTGDVVGDVTVDGATIEVGAAGPGDLSFAGSYDQTGGEIIFDILGNGQGGFDESKMYLDGIDPVDIDHAVVEFDFLNGVDSADFLADGLLNLNTFFGLSGGGTFGTQYDLEAVFQQDSFETNVAGVTITGFDPADGNLILGAPVASTPESLPTWLFVPLALAGLAGLRARERRQRRA